MAETNTTIMHDIWLKGTTDFQQRIPEPTQGSIDRTIKAILDPMNNNLYNQFVDALVMRIGETYVHQQSFKNPLAVFKKSKLMYGSTVQEMIPKWIKAHSYKDDAEAVFKMNRPDVATWYHSVNRRDRYDITIAEEELRTAFTDEYGLNKLVASFLQLPINADEYDEYRIMLQLIAFFEKNWKFFKHHISAAPNDEATGKEFLKAVKAYAGKLAFPNTVYNAGVIDDVPVFVKPKELVLLMTPDLKANIDVETLASVFNLDKANISYRTVLVDEFPVADCLAILTTEDFFQCRDTIYKNTSIYNPMALSTNYFLHHQGIYSVSPFVPAIMFTTGTGSTVKTVTQKVTGIAATLGTTTPAAGSTTPITVKLQGTLDPADVEGISVAPNAATYDVTVMRGAAAAATAVKSPTTRVDEYGILHVAKNLKTGDVIKVVVTSTYTNPSGATTEYSATCTATVK